MIPTEFEEVYFMGEVKPTGTCTALFYFKDIAKGEFVESSSIPTVYNVSTDVFRELKQELYAISRKIQATFIEHNQEPWTVLDLYFNNQGKFKVDFSYDKIDDEKCDHMTRCIVWAYKKIGITYDDGSYAQEILDEYLKENK